MIDHDNYFQIGIQRLTSNTWSCKMHGMQTGKEKVFIMNQEKMK